MAAAKKKKRFFEVSIPLIKKETQIQAFEIEEINNSYINYDITRLMRGKNMLLQAKVKVEDKVATAIPTKTTILPTYIGKMVRKGTDYVDDSFSTQAKDAIVRFKPFLVTRRKVSRAVRKALRNKAKEELVEYAKNTESEKIFEDLLKNSLQRMLSMKLKKIYPLSLCEIRVLRVEKFLDVPKVKKKEIETPVTEKLDETESTTEEKE
jgi:ribosomal protein S3AE